MAASTDNEARISLFQTIGLNEQKARETLKNQEVTRLLEATINEVNKPNDDNNDFYSKFLGTSTSTERKSNLEINR